MFFIEFLRKIRQKPKSARNKFAFAFATFFTGIIAVIWVAIVLPNKQALEKGQITERKTDTSFFSDLFNQSKKQMASVASILEEKNTSTKTEIIENPNHKKENQILPNNLNANSVTKANENNLSVENNQEKPEKTEPILLELPKTAEDDNTLDQSLIEVQIVTTKSEKPKNSEEAPVTETSPNTP